MDLTACCAIGVDIAFDRSHTSMVYAVEEPDGRIGITLEYLEGTGTADAIAVAVQAHPALLCVVVDPVSPAATLLEPLKALGVVPREPATKDVALANGMFLDELTAGRLAITDHPALSAAVQHAVPRPLAGGQAVERRKSEADASPLTAAEFALWAMLRRPPPRPVARFIDLADFDEDSDDAW